jgi:hypothetical protein
MQGRNARLPGYWPTGTIASTVMAGEGPPSTPSFPAAKGVDADLRRHDEAARLENRDIGATGEADGASGDGATGELEPQVPTPSLCKAPEVGPSFASMAIKPMMRRQTND